MNTYEVKVGVFFDSHTTGSVKFVEVKASNIYEAANVARHSVALHQGADRKLTEIVSISRKK